MKRESHPLSGRNTEAAFRAPLARSSGRAMLRLCLLALLPWAGQPVAMAAEATSAVAPIVSEPYRWNNVTVGAGGFAPNIVFHPAERGLAYLRTDMGGAYRWDAKALRWRPLQDGNAVSSYMGIESIALDPTNPDKVYLAAGMGQWGEAAIWRSTDRGMRWDIVPVPFKMGGNEDGRGLGERLAVDPHNPAVLLFGSRHDGLQRSTDGGKTWRQVEAFPHKGLGVPKARRATNAGVSFVVFDPGSRAVFAGVADPGAQRLFRSDDGGNSWAVVAGGPGAHLLPVKADIAHGQLYVAYSTSIGPNGVKAGAVWRYDIRARRWHDITPESGPQAEGGYMGLSADRQRPGRLAVSTVNRWQAGDTVWLSEDFGRTWESLKERSQRNVSAAPWLRWGGDEAEFGHWTAGLAIDPFDGGAIAYTTGATVYRTGEADKPSGTIVWEPWVRGIEQTAVITLISPTGGAPLISGFGDLAGFVHDRLDAPPAIMHLNPRLTNTNNLDYAGQKPAIVVRSGSLHAEQGDDGAWLGWSGDGGRTWQPLRVPAFQIDAGTARRHDRQGEWPIHVSADGETFVVSTPVAMATRDRGRTWFAPKGLPQGVRVIADKVDPNLFYALDAAGGRIFASRDGAGHFSPVEGRGLPRDLSVAQRRNREEQSPLVAEFSRAGALWLRLGGQLWRSQDAGATFRQATDAHAAVEAFGLGKAAPGHHDPALYATGTIKGVRGVWRSLDGGANWVRINDEAHQWGLRFRAVSGDPRRFGRVYLATDGRGLLYGDPMSLAPDEANK